MKIGDRDFRSIWVEGNAVAIEDQAPHRRRVDGADAVDRRLGVEAVVVDDLQSDQLNRQNAEQQQDKEAQQPDFGAQ